MTATREGGLKTYKKNIASDPDFYIKIGRKGGLTPKTKPGGFADRELASRAGKIGGKASGYKRRMNNA